MKLVISAVSFVEGGPLKILQDAVTSARSSLPDWEIFVLVNRLGLIREPAVKEIAFPEGRRSWLRRLWLEWFKFKSLSKSIQPDLWLSLHDITPTVIARRRVVYCHNPAPFYKVKIFEAFLDPTLFIFCIFYKYIYGLNIKNNEYVIVQQAWMRVAFHKLFRHPRILVANPIIELDQITDNHGKIYDSKIIFLYPALPRVFKNFEVICEAYKRLPSDVCKKIEIRITLQGTENRYARYLYKRFGNIDGLCFIGRQNREEMHYQYRQCNVVLFPSRLETWGLPISEAKSYGKAMLVADLPYARETVGIYDRVSFLAPNDINVWQYHIENIYKEQYQFDGGAYFRPTEPYSRNWNDLWSILVKGL